MAKSSKSHVTFSDISGENICIQNEGQKSVWQYIYSGGSVFGAKPMDEGKEYFIRFMEGSCHADIGFTQKDPYTIQNVRTAYDKELLKMVGSVRVHKQELQVKVSVKKNKFLCDTQEKIHGSLDPALPVWVYVNVKFGNARVQIESIGTKLPFHEICGENIKFFDDEKYVAKLEKESPASICCIEQSLKIGCPVYLRLKPDVSENREPPHYYHVYFGTSRLCPKELRVIGPDLFSVSNKVTPQKASEGKSHWGIVQVFKKERRENTCDGDLKIERISDHEIRYTHSLTNVGKVIERKNTQYLIFELFRTTMEVLKDDNSSEGYKVVERGPHADDADDFSSDSGKTNKLRQAEEGSWHTSSGDRQSGTEQ